MQTYKILVTGGAGFIGSNLVEKLLSLPHVSKVRVLDNLATGKMENLQPFLEDEKFEFLEGDIRDFTTCQKAVEGIDKITHQAALGSVPRSINDPLTTNQVNITGALNVFTAAKEAGIKRIVYAASSSTYGDSKSLPKVENIIGKPLSPYAVTKYVNELYADVYAQLYGIEPIGLRYFNVFGPKQNPKGAYAAVIPLFMQAVIDSKAPTINGDGLQSRDFTFVENAVNANILSLFTENEAAVNQVYNIACGEQTTLNQLYEQICEIAGKQIKPVYGPSRQGDVKHSLADISKARNFLGYEAKVSISDGLQKAFEWYKSANISI
ncbi:SDR family oxidoreductase [Chondrinema litorale]|uniref:SDR family oxidoreductase n=1 Tax=Chondrinema litorale TaxID=2994555 RepID=UPI002543F2B5|nr:SDR family oxidoreductase [Chondrinema litorale]UZR94231.1 SDR family oxidoreductase [Chondrinema litorale]